MITEISGLTGTEPVIYFTGQIYTAMMVFSVLQAGVSFVRVVGQSQKGSLCFQQNYGQTCSVFSLEDDWFEAWGLQAPFSIAAKMKGVPLSGDTTGKQI